MGYYSYYKGYSTIRVTMRVRIRGLSPNTQKRKALEALKTASRQQLLCLMAADFVSLQSGGLFEPPGGLGFKGNPQPYLEGSCDSRVGFQIKILQRSR